MPDIYLIIGYPDCRKSSTVRALTGAAQRRTFLIATDVGLENFFVQITSLQEAGIMPSDFINEMQRINSTINILSNLWITERIDGSTTYPAAAEYLQQFILLVGLYEASLFSVQISYLTNFQLDALRQALSKIQINWQTMISLHE